MALTLTLLGGDYAVCRLDPAAPLPTWATQGAFWTVSRTAEELSVLCAAEQVPAGVRAQAGWAALKLEGPFAFELTGILASVLEPLRDAGIGIFAVSTFDTDYVLVAGQQLAAAITALEAAGHQVQR
ncbi:ACT domain-containing protein [Deinococcus sp. Marseille-Q6407]|uniref:ACT domain-containing protein n=1 Tax=Deinococcus sp. Marseille-Q6407 TaxID=2969223 RepID=UPI0021BFC09E|nr:ACT domain-containing protein [Deinococcus sp. Marseille-Q6407]